MIRKKSQLQDIYTEVNYKVALQKIKINKNNIPDITAMNYLKVTASLSPGDIDGLMEFLAISSLILPNI